MITRKDLITELRLTLKSYALTSPHYKEEVNLHADLISDLLTDFDKFLDQEKESDFQKIYEESMEVCFYV